MTTNNTASHKRTITNNSGLDIISKVSEFLQLLSTQENISAPAKQRLQLSDVQQKVETYIQAGQNIDNCELNTKKLPCFKSVWCSGNSVNFLFKYVEQEPWLFFWKDGVVKQFDEIVYKSSAVGCICCHLANTLDPSIPAWYSYTINNMLQILKHRNTEVCRRSRFIVAQNFRTRKFTVFNPSIKNETQEQELDIPLIPLELYQTTLTQACSLENQIANRSFKFVQIAILARAVRHCILQGMSQRGTVEDYSIVSREFGKGLDGVGNVHSLCYLMQPGQG